MNTQCTPVQMEFPGVGRRRIVGRFDGGTLSSDAGALLLRDVEERTGLLAKVSRCFTDYRDPRRIEHSVEDLVAQRVVGLALGCEDLVPRAILKWLAACDIDTAHIDPGKPWQNATNESFNDKFRDECVSLEWFRRREEAKVLIESWQAHYTEAALGNLQLADYRNFAHGRHHWLAKRSRTGAVLAFISDADRTLAERTLHLIPSDIPQAYIAFDGGPNTVALNS